MAANAEEAANRRRFATVLLCGLCALSAIGVLIVTGRGTEVDTELAVLSSISMPEQVPAGTIVSIEVTSLSQSGDAEVTLQNGLGRLHFMVPISSGTGTLNLPASVTQQAGVITAISGEAAATMIVEPGEVAEVVAPLVGPRTIVADGDDVTLAVVLPVDRYGNQVGDGASVDLQWEQPSLVGEASRDTTIAVETENGMVFVLIPSGEVAGPTTIGATARTSAGEVINAAAVRIDEVPGTVRQIDLLSVDPEGVADGRSLVALITDTLVDRFNNQLSDGTSAQFVFAGPAGQGVVPATVQNGVVRVELVAPDRPGTLTGRLEVQGQESNEISIEFTSGIASFEAELERIGDDVVLRIDDAIDPNGSFVADGTEVEWGEHVTQIRQGAAEIWLPAGLVADPVPSIEILGLEQHAVGSRS